MKRSRFGLEFRLAGTHKLYWARGKGRRRQQIAASAVQGASLRCPQSTVRLRHGPVSVAAALPSGAERRPGQAGQRRQRHQGDPRN